MTEAEEGIADDLDAFFAVLDQARAESDASRAALVGRMHAQQEQLAAAMPRLLEETFGVTLPEGLHFAWQGN